ncbi:MAG: SdrD B-like domain-containing protein, partial [Acidobacteriota bacterium]
MTPTSRATSRRLLICAALVACLANPAAAQLRQIFFVPLDETHVRDVAFAINATAGDVTHTVISLSATADGTTVFYDHWEDGYEDDLENPVQPTTETFMLDAGDFIALEDDIDLAPRDTAIIEYDGRDKIGTTEQIAVTRAGWRLVEATLLAGAVEVFPTIDWGLRFEFPLGEDIATSQSFEYVAASIQAGDNGAIFDIDTDGDGVVDSTITLGQGETTLVTGVQTGGTIVSSDPLQVDLLTGDVGSTFASRWYNLVSTDIWGSSYYSPVASVATSETRVFLYNPNNSSIDVTHETLQTTVTTRTYDNTTAGTVDGTTTCAAPLVRTFNVPDTFTVSAARLGFNATHPYRGDIRATLISPGGTTRVVVASNGGDGDNNYDILVDTTSNNALDDGNADTTGAPFYDRTVTGLVDFGGDAANGTWTLQICDVFPGADDGTFNRAQLQLDEATGTSTVTGTVAVAAGAITEFVVPNDSAAHFFTATEELFFATAAVDFADTSSDWGFTLLPEDALATTIVTGWAPGRDPASGVNPAENGSPIWVTATGATDLYVDFDGDPTTGALVDMNGNRYDQLVPIAEFESIKLFDPADGDQSGARVYTLDQTLIAAAWGQDAVNASPAAPAIDVGTTVVPLDALRAIKEASLLNDADGDGALGPGDTMRYTITITNVSEAVVSGATVEDFGLDPNLTYVADTTEIGGLAIPDDTVGATIFPLDEGGQPLATIGIGQTVDVTFAVIIADPLPVGIENLVNQVRVSTSTQIEVGSTLTTIRTPVLEITKTSNAVGDVAPGQTIDYTVTVTNVSGDAARGIRVLDTLPGGTLYNAESTSATGFVDVFSGTLAVSDEVVGGQAFENNTNPCGGTPITRTFDIATAFTVSEVEFALNILSTRRSDIQAVLESPTGTRVTILTGSPLDFSDNYDVLFDDDSANPIDDGTNDNPGTPFYDRTVNPANPLSAFDGEAAFGTWTLELCDDQADRVTTYNRAELRLTGSTSTASTKTNAAAAVDPLFDGDPDFLVAAPDGFGLLSGQTMTVTYQVTVEDPLAFDTIAITNTALVTSLEQPQPLTATVVDPVTEGAAIGDRVWFDVDGDGFQDVGEPGLANVTVNLFDPGGDGMVGGGDDTLLATLVTDGNGNYLFDRLDAGSYYVDVDGTTLPAGLTTSPGTTDPSAVVTVAAEETRTDVDFGYTNADPATAILGDFVWSDADADGFQDPGEPGLGGVTVELLDSGGGVLATVVTADDGSYLFTGVTPAEVRVRIAASNFTGGNALDGYTVTTGPQSEGADTSDPVTLDAGDVVTDVDFGYDNPSTYSISNSVWLDRDSDTAFDPAESGIDGVTVDLLDASGDVIATTTTATDGSFSFDGVAPGNYTISISDNGGELIGLAGTTTAGSARQLAVTVVAADVTGIDFGFNGEASLGDRVWSDADGDGVQDPDEVGLVGVTVELLDRGGMVIGTTVTDAFGNYLFEGVAPEQYTVRVDGASLPAGFTQTGDPDVTFDGQAASILTIGDADLVLDFGYQNTSLADISGNVFSDLDRDGIDDGVGEPVFEAVTLALVDSSGNVIATTSTDANGDYTFPDLPAGSYSVAVVDDVGVLNDYQLTSGLDTIDVTLAGTDITGIDFGYARNAGTGAIGDFVWLDADRDGIQDAGESGLSGVDLDLYDVGPDGAIGGGDDVLVASTTTDANGGYVFSGLDPGAYYVDVDGATVPSGLAPSTGTTDPSAIVLLSEGELDDTVDFGYAGTASSSAIGDRVWADVDGDGVQDPGEVGIAGVTVDVVGPSGSFTTVTGADGSWLVTGLAPGTYTVTVDSTTLPAAFDSVPTNGPASREYDVTATTDVLTADFGFDGTPLGSIGDLVFLDEDGDGIQGVGEDGIAGVTVDLLDSVGNIVATTTTDASGAYDFVGLTAGDYQVRVSDVGQVLTGLNLSGGSNPTTITLAAGQDYDDADFPYAPSSGSGTIGSLVWNDLDGDGVRDTGEPGLEGVTLALWHDIDGNGVIEPGTDNLLRTTTTDENGEYEFVGLLPEDYLVDVTDTAGVLTGTTKTSGTAGVDDNSQADPYAVTLTLANPSNDTADFGYQATTPRTISGTAFEDDNSDAAQNGGEAGVPGGPVILYLDLAGDGVLDAVDPQIATTATHG